jgi:uncharacterized protein with GYD domain
LLVTLQADGGALAVTKSRRENKTMPTYITLYSLTAKGAKDIKNAPQRVEGAIKAFEAMGGNCLAFTW